MARLDARGLPGGLATVERARALAEMAEQRVQHLGWDEIETDLLPGFGAEHPLVAATLARVVGTLYGDGGRRIQNGPAWPLDRMLGHIAALARNRRPVAGGFLDGYRDYGDPLYRLRRDLAGSGFALDDWVLEVLSDETPEPCLPGAQAFWFFVHEHYWASPDFVLRLIEPDHLWEAMMCATEQPDAESGMAPVLRRLADCADVEIAAHCRDVLSRAFPDAGPDR